VNFTDAERHGFPALEGLTRRFLVALVPAGLHEAVRHSLEVTMLILAVGSAVAIAAKRIGVAYNVALVLVGLALVFLRVLPAQPLDPEMILIGVLPVLIFEGALFANLDHLRDAIKPVLTLAIPGVALALFGTAVVANWGLELPFSVALLLGAILAITDTVSVLLAFRAVRVALGATVLRATPDHLTAVLVSIVVVFGASLFAESLHTSSVIAVVVVGLALGRSARRSLPSSRVLALNGFWETVGFGLNVLVFLLVGMQLQASSLIAEAPTIVLALCATHVGRALAVYGSFAALRGFASERVPMAWQHVMVLGNIKGALSMAAVLALPDSVPFKSRLIAIVFGVTLVTLITQALPFPRMLRWVGVIVRSTRGELEGARANLVAARSGQAELDALLAAGLVSRRAHAERKAQLQREAIAADRVLRAADIEGDDLHVESAVLQAQRGALIEAAHRGTIDVDAAQAHVAEIDERILRVRDRVEAIE
jgi:CPA1 family monovalent cation:H+ antiporter